MKWNEKKLKEILCATVISCIELLVVEEDRSCVVSVTSSPIHIARPSTSSSSSTQSNARLHCGTKTQPWLIEAPAGQRINVSLLDFTPSSTVSSAVVALDSRNEDPTRVPHHSGGGVREYGCAHLQKKYQYGYLIDKSSSAINKRNISVCGGTGSQRLSNVYLSSSNAVEIVFRTFENSASDDDDVANFLIKVQGKCHVIFFTSYLLIVWFSIHQGIAACDTINGFIKWHWWIYVCMVENS